ncbi:hypothetical protein [Desulfovibrio oxyclinae]|uniref:hypothetical protein n=1 Tax=Desulfovibrio oxyclinae TaxID=63560 RepID=UPI000378E8EE|nr:hypothetical protein [Desulfovibrio oxyclinae]
MTTIANEYEISTETVFSGTNGDVPESILGYGRFSSEFDNRFGGIFASPERAVAESHGETVFEMSLGRYISADDFRHLAFYSDHAEDVAALMLAEIDDERCVSDINADLMLELVAEDENVFDLDNEVASELLEQFGFDSLGELSWDIQGLKGEICRRMGFDSVGMEDEHGESILVLNLI